MKSLSFLLGLSLCTLLLASPAQAQDNGAVDEAVLAEQERLQKELQSLVSREAWDGVERVYLELLKLEAQGVMVTYAEHVLGAQAAQNRGDVVSTRQRLEAALSQWSTDLARSWLADINTNFGQVTISLPQRGRTAIPLQIGETPIEHERRAAISFAQARLDTDRKFEGYLPLGAYTIGDQTFTVEAGRPASVEVGQPAHPGSGSETRTDPDPGEGGPISGRLRLGIGYARAGSPSAGIQPVSFGGASPRIGLGVGVGLTETIGLGIEAGWMAAFAGTEQLSVGYGVLTGETSLPVGPGLTVGAGPMLAVGRGSASSLDAEALAEHCAGVTDGSCAGLSLASGASTITGGIRAVGPALSAGVPIFSAGSLSGSGVLLLSALSDSSRWYPVAQAAVQVSIGGEK